MKGIYFIDHMDSFRLGSPDMVEAWKHLIMEHENRGNTVVTFSIPKRDAQELIVMIEKLLKDKLR